MVLPNKLLNVNRFSAQYFPILLSESWLKAVKLHDISLKDIKILINVEYVKFES